MTTTTSTTWTDDAERIAVLQQELPLFLPWEFVRDKVLVSMCLTVLVLSVFSASVYLVLGWIMEKQDATSAAKRKASYQLTNLMVNFVLAFLGLYHFVYTVPSSSSNNKPSVDERVTGWEDSLYILASIQLGYQLWAMPVGYFFVNESLIMLIHHVATVGVASLCGFFTNGFRYYSPYFFGLYEFSSVPLAIINAFKENPKYIEKYPTVYTTVRHVFAVIFLYVRVYMMIPRKYGFLCDCYLLLRAIEDSWWHWAFIAMNWWGGFFLACLQLYWAGLIVKILRKSFFPKKKKESKKMK